jgi:hypothetical protein
MYSISLLIAAGCMVFLYSTQHPANVVVRSGLQNLALEELKRSDVMRIAARIRLVLGLMVMITVTIAGYRVPVEIGNMIATAQERQVQLQSARHSNRLAAEKRHVESMIETFGGADGYLTYLQSVRNVN